MQVTTKNRRIPSAARQRSADGKAIHLQQVWSKQPEEKTFTSSLGLGSGILNTRFSHIIAESDIIDRDELYDLNDINKEYSLQYLYDSAKNYCQLLGKGFNPIITGNYHLDVLAVYSELANALPANYSLNIDVKSGTSKHLVFLIYSSGDFPDQFFFLPLCKIEFMPKALANLFLRFVRFYSESQSIFLPSEHMDYDYILTCFLYEALEESEENGFHEEALKYSQGIIPNTFKKLTKMSSPNEEILMNNLLKARHQYFGKDLDLIDGMIEGMYLFQKGAIGNFGEYDDNKSTIDDDYHSESKVEFNRTLAIVWEDDDGPGQLLQEAINTDIGEFGCVGAIEHLVISPDTKQPLYLSKYPMQFCNWFVNFFEKLDQYEQDN